MDNDTLVTLCLLGAGFVGLLFLTLLCMAWVVTEDERVRESNERRK